MRGAIMGPGSRIIDNQRRCISVFTWCQKVVGVADCSTEAVAELETVGVLVSDALGIVVAIRACSVVA